MAAMNDPFGGSNRTDVADGGRDRADVDALSVDRDLNRIFAATVRRPPPPLSKKALLEAKREFRGTPQRGVGLTVVMGLAVAVGLFGLCVWTLLDKVQDATDGAGTPPTPIAAVAYNKPLSGTASASGSSGQNAEAPSASVPAATPQAVAAAPAAASPPVSAPPSLLPAPAPIANAKAAVKVAPLAAVPRPPAAAALPPAPAATLARAAPSPPPRVAIPAPQAASQLAFNKAPAPRLPPAAPRSPQPSPYSAPPPAQRAAVPTPKALPQLAFNKVSAPRATSQASTSSADAMLRSLAAEPLKPGSFVKTDRLASGGAELSASNAAGAAKACDTAEGCGSYGLVQAADTRLSRAYNAAVEAGVSQQLLSDVKGRWAGLRNDTSRPPGLLLADYGAMARSLWKARDQAIGGQRSASDRTSDEQVHSVPPR